MRPLYPDPPAIPPPDDTGFISIFWAVVVLSSIALWLMRRDAKRRKHTQ